MAEINEVLWSLACMQLYVTFISLYATRSGTSSQCSCNAVTAMIQRAQ